MLPSFVVKRSTPQPVKPAGNCHFGMLVMTALMMLAFGMTYYALRSETTLQRVDAQVVR